MKSKSRRLRFRVIAPAYPAFNIYTRFARDTTALGPVLVATAASRMDGWDVEVIDENNYRKFGPRDNTGRPDHNTLQTIRAADVVGLYGGLSSTIPRLYELAAFYKKQGVITITGGQHFIGDNIQDALENGIDYVVCGEGEDTIRELLLSLRENGETGQIAGIAYMQNGNMVQIPESPPITDFERMPLADFDLVRYAKIKVYPINWIRGCGMDCEFCTVKGKPRSTSVERVVEQIASLVEAHNAKHFFIVDDLFGHRRTEALKLCRMLASYRKAIDIKLNITVQIRLDRSRDAELLQAMREAGVKIICIGYESPIPEELKAMNKKIRPEEMLEMTRKFHKAGFLVHGMFIFGYPIPDGVQLNLSERERVRQFKKFIRKGRLDTIQLLLPVPLPGTELTTRLNEQKRVFNRDIIGWEYYDGNFPVFQPDAPLTPEKMHTALKKINGRFYRFRYMFAIGLNILIFPSMVFSVFSLRVGWRKWHRLWRNALRRFGGWIIFSRWASALKQSNFHEKLNHAGQNLNSSEPVTQEITSTVKEEKTTWRDKNS
jgi:radical SAM superfamily enzyme YgiQ (UPF0313 family)